MYPTQLARRLSALTGALLVLLTNLSSLCGGFPEDLYPLHQIPFSEGSPEYEVFCGHRHSDEFSNCSHNYEFQLLRELAYDGRNHLLLGAKNHVFLVDVEDFQIFRSKIEWKSTEDDQGMCQMKGLMKHECHNFIRVLELRNDSTLFVCGTNAYDPKCRDYPLERFSERSYSGGAPTMSGIAKCPFDPSHKNTAVFADGKLYSATVADFTARDTVIYRSLGYSEPYDPTLKTEQYDSKWLNEPSFIKSFEHGNKVFFFFKETAVEYINCGKTIYSRVARVCKDDQGGQRVLQNRWTTFMKARLNCSVPGEYPFYFDEIQAMTDLIQVGDSYRMYAVFTTPQNSISGSAVCAFDMENITEAFDGKYKEQETTQSTWLPVPPNRVPSPRPGNCVNNSKLVPDTTLNFVKTHPLMDSAVGAWGGEPLFIKTGSARFTAIAVDTAAGIGNHLVMFIGTNTGKVLKILYVDGRQVFLEEIEVMDQDTPEAERSILNLRLVQKTPGEKVLVAVTQRKVVQVPLARCQRYSSCRSCVKAQDPYCGWSGDNNDCREAVSNTLQDILNGDHTSFSGYTCSGFSDYGDTSPQSTQAPCECRSPGPATTAQVTLHTTPGEVTSPTTSPVPLPSQTDPPGVQLGEPVEMPAGKVEQTVVKPPDLHVSSQVGSYPGGSPTTLALAIVFSVIGGIILGVLVTYCVVCRQGGKDSHESHAVVEVPASPPREKNEFPKNGSLNNLADTCNYINNTKKQDNYKMRNENFNHNQNSNGSPSTVPNGTIPNGSPGQMASMHVKDSDIRRESLIDRERMAVSGYATLDRDVTAPRKLPGVPADTSPKHRYPRAHGPINPNEYDMGEFITPPKVPTKQTLPPRVPPKAGTLGRDGRPKPMGPKPVPPPKPPQLRMQQHHHHRHADS
ncbi:semaphorin-1A-like isoform X3 [Branchiostoma lanceolatum]|uniref:semaphorin-1A-like isoform X3 n=1 Tax=Branchiostoma lanceolatum TaxID=7740 RepID=UPI003453A639